MTTQTPAAPGAGRIKSRYYVYENKSGQVWHIADTRQNEPREPSKDYIVAECRSEAYARQIADLLSKVAS